MFKQQLTTDKASVPERLTDHITLDHKDTQQPLSRFMRRPSDILALQRTVGNQAVQQIFAPYIQPSQIGEVVQRMHIEGEGTKDEVCVFSSSEELPSKDGIYKDDGYIYTIIAQHPTELHYTRRLVEVSPSHSEGSADKLKNKKFEHKNGLYTFQYTRFDKNGQCRLEVFVNGETDPVGYAEYTVQTVGKRDVPKEEAPYTKEDVLAREEKVAHLTGIYNTTLIREGPADIYRGFGTKLLKEVENDAKSCGAKLIYLEAAASMVRIDPNTTEKKLENSKTFYEKYGYGIDNAALVHNWPIADKEAKSFVPDDPAQQIKYIQKQMNVLVDGMLSKKLS